MQASTMRPMGLRSGPVQRCIVRPFTATRAHTVVVVAAEPERLRLNNLSPWKGSRDLERRKGRGHAAGQGATCGFGTRGQKSRSGSSVRPGFEGGQTPLYRRLPKLKGIAGGMGAGLPDFVVVNLYDLEQHFAANEEVTIDSVKAKVKSVSGSDASLPLKVLGSGELSKPLVIKARSFSKTAAEKIAAAGGKTEELAGPKKWSKKIFKKLVKSMEEQGLDYKVEAAKKRAARAIANGQVSNRRKAKAVAPPKSKPGRVTAKSS